MADVRTPDRAPQDRRATSLRAAGVTVRFGGVVAVDDVSLDVSPGEIHGLIGPNGAGKTTLFDVLSGARRPNAGRVTLADQDVTGRSSTWRARHGLRRTFQRQQVFGALTVRDNLLVAQEGSGMVGGVALDLLGLAARRRSARSHRARADRMLELCDLTAVADVDAGSLPIGVARMVELARALVDDPTVLLLDEPTSGLGEAETDLMADTLDRYLAEHDCAVVLVEHDVGFVMQRCHRVTVMNLGQVIASGTPAEVQADAAVRAAYLG